MVCQRRVRAGSRWERRASEAQVKVRVGASLTAVCQQRVRGRSRWERRASELRVKVGVAVGGRAVERLWSLAPAELAARGSLQPSDVSHPTPNGSGASLPQS